MYLKGYEEDGSVSEGKKKPLRPGSAGSQLSTVDPTAGRESGEQPEKTEEEVKQPTLLEGTEGESTSISTGAAHKVAYGSESEELPTVELPDTIQLPTPGVEYASLSANRIKQLMDSITSLIFHRLMQSLLEEDQLLLRTLLCLNIQSEAGEDFSTEEMSLFLQGNPGLGMQLTLSDFDSKDSPPTWLSQEQWEDVMALSVLPGPLDSLCVSFASASQAWHQWYTTPYPEQEPLPLSERAGLKAIEKEEDIQGAQTEGTTSSPDLGSLTDFHQLLILRMLRPDRLPSALARYTEKHLRLNDPAENSMSIAEVLLGARSHLGVLLLLPLSTAVEDMVPESRLKLTDNPVNALLKVAKDLSITVERVSIGDGCEILVEEAIDTADKNDGWVVIEALHLAHPSFFISLRQLLQRVAKSRANTVEGRSDGGHFCVWLTCETDSNIPRQLTQSLHKVSWTHIMFLAKNHPAAPSQRSSKGGVACLSPKYYLHEGGYDTASSSSSSSTSLLSLSSS